MGLVRNKTAIIYNRFRVYVPRFNNRFNFLTNLPKSLLKVFEDERISLVDGMFCLCKLILLDHRVSPTNCLCQMVAKKRCTKYVGRCIFLPFLAMVVVDI